MFTKKTISAILRIVLLAAFLAGAFGVQPARAESINFGWAQRLGGTGDDYTVMALDDSGNMYITGFLVNTPGDNNILVAKLDGNGNFLWSKTMGGSSVDEGRAVAIADDGSVYITGCYSASVDFDPGAGINNLTSAGSNDIFLGKFDSDGNFLWAKGWGGTGSDIGNAVAMDNDGNLYITGSYSDTVDFDPGAGTSNLTSAGSSDIFISKFDGNGNFLWAKSVGGASDDRSYDIAVDGSGSTLVTGSFSGTVDFDPSAGTNALTSEGLSDAFTSKLDNNGNFVWVSRVGYATRASGYKVAIDENGDVYTVGWLETSYNYDVFISKLDGNGNSLWTKGVIGPSYDMGNDIAVDDNGDVYITGSFGGTVDFDWGTGVSNLTSVGGSNDVYVTKWDSSGNFIWVKGFGGSEVDQSTAVAVDSNGNVYLAGFFSETADFDPGAGTYNLTSAGSFDLFVSKLAVTHQIYYVKQGATGANDGSSWTDAFTDLQSALATASSGDEIWVAAGTYKPTAGTDRTVSFALKNGVAVYGGFVGMEASRNQRNPTANATILSGDIDNNDSQTPVITDLATVTGNTTNSYHVVTGTTGPTLDGFTITAGNANENDTASGGGMSNYNSSPMLTNVIFSGNLANSGGGGMSNYNSNPMLTNVTFSSNSADAGGGMSNYNSNPMLTNVTFSSNSADAGGGMLNHTSSPMLTNVTFSGNSVLRAGGGMSNYFNSNPIMTNVTFSSNSALNNYGGGIDNYQSNPTIRNTILWGNTAPTHAQFFDDGGSTSGVSDSVVQGGCSAGSTCTNIITDDPMLGTLGDHGGNTQTIPLLPGSSAINAGNDTLCAAAVGAPDYGAGGLDQRGVTRPQGAKCDIGAYEAEPDRTPPTVSIARASADPTSVASVDFTVTFSEPVSGVETEAPFPDFSLTTGDGIRDAAITAISGDGTTYTVTVNTGIGSGNLYLSVVDDDSIQDAAGNLLGGVGTGTISGEFYSVEKQYAVPGKPTGLLPATGTATSNPQPVFRWGSVTDAVEYEILFAGNSAFTQGAVSYFVTDPTFTPETPMTEGKYYWRVKAYNVLDESGVWSAVHSLTIDTVVPAAPVLQSPVDGVAVRTVPTFRWKAVSGAVLYQFELDNDDDFSSPVVSLEQRTLSRKPAGSLRGTYYWHVRAKDAAGNWSEWSPVFAVTIVRAR